jgi:hypothetical protein
VLTTNKILRGHTLQAKVVLFCLHHCSFNWYGSWYFLVKPFKDFGLQKLNSLRCTVVSMSLLLHHILSYFAFVLQNCVHCWRSQSVLLSCFTLWWTAYFMQTYYLTKNAVFWDVAPCRSCVNQCFGGTYHLHLKSRKIGDRGTSMSRLLQSAVYSHTHMHDSMYVPMYVCVCVCAYVHGNVIMYVQVHIKWLHSHRTDMFNFSNSWTVYYYMF